MSVAGADAHVDAVKKKSNSSGSSVLKACRYSVLQRAL